MEAWLSEDYEQDQSISRKSSQIKAAEWDGDPGVHVLQARNATQQEGRGHAAAVLQGPQWHCV